MSIDFSTLKGLAIPEGSVTQIVDSSGNVLWKASSGGIVFYIDAVEYQAEEGMTWWDWYESMLNEGIDPPIACAGDGDKVYDTNLTFFVCKTNDISTVVYDNELIEENYKYYFVYDSGLDDW